MTKRRRRKWKAWGVFTKRGRLITVRLARIAANIALNSLVNAEHCAPVTVTRDRTTKRKGKR